MSQGTEAEKLYSAIEESARLVGASFSRDQVWPILDAFQDTLLPDGAIIFSAQINAGQVGELEYTIQVSPGAEGPYDRALSAGLLKKTEHPVGNLLTELQERVHVDDWFIDGDITNGFKKVYAQFPRSLQKVSEIAAMPSMPRAVADNVELFARHGLEEVALVGVNYQRKSANLYFQLPADVAGAVPAETVSSLLRHMGLPDPDEKMLAYATKAYRAYATLTWDSSQIQRIAFAPMPSPGLDLSALPAQLDPELVRFLKNSPYTYTGERVNASAAKWSSVGDHLDLVVYHQIPPRWLKMFTENAAAA